MIFRIALACCGLAVAGSATTISFGGKIIQSTQDGTGPAMNNPSLNNIKDGQDYTVTLTFAGSITAPGTYNLTGSSLIFAVPTAPATEPSFDFIGLTVTANGGFDDLSLLACLTIGDPCPPFAGNGMTAIFRIPAAMLNSQNVTAIGLDLPLDLLEDPETTGTDIHGSITSYSYTGSVNAVPEPCSAILLGCVLVALAARRRHKADGAARHVSRDY
jgi:hypothetical protein